VRICLVGRVTVSERRSIGPRADLAGSAAARRARDVGRTTSYSTSRSRTGRVRVTERSRRWRRSS